MGKRKRDRKRDERENAARDARRMLNDPVSLAKHLDEGNRSYGLFQQIPSGWTHREQRDLSNIIDRQLRDALGQQLDPSLNPVHMKVSEDEVAKMPEPRSFVNMGSMNPNALGMDPNGLIYIHTNEGTEKIATVADTNTRVSNINPVTQAANNIQSQITAMREMIVQQQEEITRLSKKVERLERRRSGPVSRKRGVKPTE